MVGRSRRATWPARRACTSISRYPPLRRPSAVTRTSTNPVASRSWRREVLREGAVVRVALILLCAEEQLARSSNDIRPATCSASMVSEYGHDDVERTSGLQELVPVWQKPPSEQLDGKCSKRWAEWIVLTSPAPKGRLASSATMSMPSRSRRSTFRYRASGMWPAPRFSRMAPHCVEPLRIEDPRRNDVLPVDQSREAASGIISYRSSRRTNSTRCSMPIMLLPSAGWMVSEDARSPSSSPGPPPRPAGLTCVGVLERHRRENLSRRPSPLSFDVLLGRGVAMIHQGISAAPSAVARGPPEGRTVS